MNLESQATEPTRSAHPVEAVNREATRIGTFRKTEGFTPPTAERIQQALPEAKEIARAELVRCGRRLGRLTREQEMAVENLLISTVTRISRLTESVIESWPYVL